MMKLNWFNAQQITIQIKTKINENQYHYQTTIVNLLQLK